MKWFIVCFCVSVLASCAAQKPDIIKEVGEMNKSMPVDDPVIENLRKQNDVLLVAAVINTAWVKSTTYNILAKKGNEWKGVLYVKNQMPNNNKPGNVSEITVYPKSCDSILKSAEDKKAWTISGDKGKDFCADKKCMIYDAASAQLMIATPSGFSSAGYYAPEYFEECCPGNVQRALFVSITKQIHALFENANSNPEK